LPCEALGEEEVLNLKEQKDMKLELHVSFFEGRRHLPIVELKPAA